MEFKSIFDFYSKNEYTILQACALLMFLTGGVVHFILLFTPATYGRYSNTERFYSLAIPAKLSWFVQEIPAFIISTGLVITAQLGFIPKAYSTYQLMILSLFIFHYFQRTFIYSLTIIGGKPTPLYAFLLAFVFCSFNGFMQARGTLLFTNYPQDSQIMARVILGIGLFAFGILMNIHSDYILRNLRKPGEKGYKIPRGGMFEYVSCANFLGEIIEWSGYAIASWNWTSFAFAFFTCANLLPRALFHHRFYHEKFDDYPKGRKAVIPFLI